jgi:tetratricopeptide (TPR) repeat protein
LVAVLLIGCGQTTQEPESSVRDALGFKNAVDRVEYIGDEACASCHEEQYQGFQTHGMSRSFAPPLPDHMPVDFSETIVYHEPTDFYYRVYASNGQFYQEEYRLNSAGVKTHQLVREMKYAMGSGNAAYTYFTEQNGRYYQLPLTWYTHPQKWDLSPGFEANNKRFDRMLTDRCAFCHNSYPTPVAFSDEKFETTLTAIGCERCHGPGALHEEVRLAQPEPGGEVDSTIVNPTHLPLDRRLDVCQQCHLNGTTALLRQGRESFEFRPGERQDQHMALFSVRKPESSALDVISHADRMQQSACFIQTRSFERPMDCVTCHNPHEGFRQQGPAYFNTTCQTCHKPETLQTRVVPAAQPDHRPASNCITCHMPRVGSEVGPHTLFTDHWIRVVEDSVQTGESGTTPERVELIPYFDRDAEPAGKIYESMAYMSYGRTHGDTKAMEHGVELAQQALPSHRSFGDAYLMLGQSLLALNRADEAVPVLEHLVDLDEEDPRRLQALAQALERTQGDPETIASLYERALAIQPDLASLQAEYASFMVLMGQSGKALQAYTETIEEKPWSSEAYLGLGYLMLQQQQYGEAEQALRRALLLDPDLVEAMVNLGITFGATGRFAEAVAFYEQALELNPRHVPALYNLGLFHLQQNRLAQSVALFEQAVELQPRYLNAWVNLAFAYLRMNRYPEAGTAARKALELDPENARAQQILGAVPAS